jgi:importin-4
MEMTPRLIPLFEHVLSPPEEQLDDETRGLIQKAVQLLYKGKPELFGDYPGVLKLAGQS